MPISKADKTTLEDIKAELELMRIERMPKVMGTVPVDSGTIHFSTDSDLERASKTYQRVQEICGFTARVVCQNGRGGISMGADGSYEVVRVRYSFDMGTHFSVLLPRRSKKLYFGDCGKVYVEIPLSGDSEVLCLGLKDNQLLVYV